MQRYWKGLDAVLFVFVSVRLFVESRGQPLLCYTHSVVLSAIFGLRHTLHDLSNIIVFIHSDRVLWDSLWRCTIVDSSCASQRVDQKFSWWLTGAQPLRK